jgi:aminopeptidase N
MIGFMSSVFGSYPFVTSGGILDNVEIGFALETQTRPTYSPGFFFDGPNDFVVVHELAHQWYGDSLAVERWQDIWLNEGFATYAEWLWSAREGFGTEQENFDFWFEEVFGDDNEFWDLPIGDPGPVELFNFAVYIRGAMTLQVLRNEIGDADFFRLLQRWAQSQAGGNVTTDEFIALAEKISGEELDDLFDVWLFGTDRPVLDAAALRSSDSGKGKDKAPKQVRAMLERFGQEYRLANPAKLRKTGG